MKIPPGMPKAQAEAVVDYLKSNPEAARMAAEQAKEIMKTPGLAQAYLNMQVRVCAGVRGCACAGGGGQGGGVVDQHGGAWVGGEGG